MTARVLVTDDVPANVRLLKVRLEAEYFDVITAASGLEAIGTCETSKVDVLIVDTMMPNMDGFEVCRRLKGNPATAYIPIVLLTAVDRASDRIRGLEAGADDFLTKPVNDLQLVTRVKSLVRLKMLTDELRLRASTTRNIGIEELLAQDGNPAVLVVDEQPSSSERLAKLLAGSAEVTVVSDPQLGLFEAAKKSFECMIIATGFSNYDPLRICSLLRSNDRTRFLPIVLIADEGEEQLIIRGLDLGVNDYLTRPLDPQELTARLRTQVKRKRYNDYLRASVTQTIELAMVDGLTGLHNRRYLDSHLQALFDHAVARRRPLAVAFIDIDCLKSINDTHGHDAGSRVLRAFGTILRESIRSTDIACHYGGDEFVVILPNSDMLSARKIAYGIREAIAHTSINLIDSSRISFTASIGISTISSRMDSSDGLMARADSALYQAKRAGRNRIFASESSGTMYEISDC